MKILIFVFPVILFAQTEVYKYEFPSEFKIKFVRAIPDEMETYTFTSENGRQMQMACAGNIFYDHNKQAILEYRNFYNQRVSRFKISDNRICLDLAHFIESVHMGINEKKPFVFHFNSKTMSITKIYYPRINPYMDIGDIEDLLPKKPVQIKYNKEKKKEKASPQIELD